MLLGCGQAVIFVDNSGADVVLGILPFARELLRRGTVVKLAPLTTIVDLLLRLIIIIISIANVISMTTKITPPAIGVISFLYEEIQTRSPRN